VANIFKTTQQQGFSKSRQDLYQEFYQENAVTWLHQSELSSSSWLHDSKAHVEHATHGFNQVDQGFIVPLLRCTALA